MVLDDYHLGAVLNRCTSFSQPFATGVDSRDQSALV
jgi:hypothetical protein